MGSVNIPQNQLAVNLPQNQMVPQEGPKAIPLLLNFGNAASFTLNLLQLQEQGFISMLQTLYIDMSGASDPLTITVNITNQKLVIPINTQGYYSILCPNPPQLTFANTSGSDVIPVFLINAPIPGVVWSTT